MIPAIPLPSSLEQFRGGLNLYMFCGLLVIKISDNLACRFGGLLLLRIPAIHDAKLNKNLLIYYLSEIRGAFFDNLPRDEKSWKAHPGGRAEIKNVT